MIRKATIARNLYELDARYNRKSRNVRDPLYYSKLSLIELCGWIETSMDDIAEYCINKFLKQAKNRNHARKTIKRISGFRYKDHFREMLIGIIGLGKVEELEGMLDPVKFDMLDDSLRTLSDIRNPIAHTHLANVTQSLLAPSVIRGYFVQVYEGLKNVEYCVRRLPE